MSGEMGGEDGLGERVGEKGEKGWKSKRKGRGEGEGRKGGWGCVVEVMKKG